MIRDDAIKICNLLIEYFNLKKDEVSAYITELKDYDYKSTEKAIKQLSNEKHKPTIAEIKNSIISTRNFSNANFDSCYWYKPEREWCEENNKPYYDILTGKPLTPFN